MFTLGVVFGLLLAADKRPDFIKLDRLAWQVHHHFVIDGP